LDLGNEQIAIYLWRALLYASGHFQVRTLNPISRNPNTSKYIKQNQLKYYQILSNFKYHQEVPSRKTLLIDIIFVAKNF